MASKRRMGPQDSETSAALLDAVEHVLREEGYAAASSRRVAEVAGLKQQLVYYYFATMDELLLAAFRRRTERALKKLEVDLATERPIDAIWANLNGSGDARLSFEFMALANRHEGIREEVARYVTLSRRMQADAIARQWREQGIDTGPVSPGAAAFLMYCATLILGRENATGIDEAHDEVRALFDRALTKVR
jgi:AcrR family transcriptional regulator